MSVVASTPVGSNPVTGAIRNAAQATGASFDYLLATTKVESDLDPNLTMRSSSATGLFQFLEQTWLATLKQAGPAFGYGDLAGAISRTASGRYVVENPALRGDIMALRKDPAANAMMGAAFTQQNAAVLSAKLGRAPSESELYIGHFFGPYAGAKAIGLAASTPWATGADIFPAAARANRPIFYDKQGNARSIAGVCAELTRRFQVARTQSRTSPVVIAGAPLPSRPSSVIAASSTGAQRLASPLSAPDAATLRELMFRPTATPAVTAFAEDAAAPNETAGGIFHSLFQSGERREAVASTVREL